MIVRILGFNQYLGLSSLVLTFLDIHKQTSSRGTHFFLLALVENPYLTSIHHNSNDQQMDHSFIFYNPSRVFLLILLLLNIQKQSTVCARNTPGPHHLQLQGKERMIHLSQLRLISCPHCSFSTTGFYSLLPDRKEKGELMATYVMQCPLQVTQLTYNSM